MNQENQWGSMKNLHEFEVIDKFFTRAVKNPRRFPLGVGDDAALIAVPPGHELATSIDTLLAGRHFPVDCDPYDIGYKSLAVSLSDLAAMGTEPVAVLLALTLPEAKEKWLTEFASGFFHLAEQFRVELIGGNLTRGPLSISTVVYGWAPAGQALRRSGAKPGDEIYVTGHLGDAGLALRQIQQQPNALIPALHQRFFRPYPQIRAGLALRDIATAAIDISDGLAADLNKLLTASQCGGTIYTERLPLSTIMRNTCSREEAIHLALTAGEDYELCFTAPPYALQKTFPASGCTIHCLGTVTLEAGLKILNANGNPIEVKTPGYEHF